MSTLYVTTQGAYVRLQGGHLIVSHKDEQLLSMPEAAVNSVVLLGHVQVSTQAVHELLDRGIPLLYCSRTGRFKGLLQPSYPKNTHIRLAQYEASLNAPFSTDFARAIALSKLRSQEQTLKRWRRNNWLETLDGLDDLLALRETLSQCQTTDQIRGIEAIAAKRYFQILGDALPPPFVWTARTRQPPRDPVNALMSLSYMLAVSEAVSACYSSGLDPFVGFLHQLDYGRPSFALDLIEPLRAFCCDHFVVGLLQAEILAPEEFTTTESEGCRLTGDGFSRFLLRYDAMKNGTGNQRVTLTRLLCTLVRESVTSVTNHSTPDWEALITGGE